MNLGAPELLLLLPMVALPVFVLWWALRAPRLQDIQLWASAYGVAVTERNEPVLRHYLRRQQRWRRLGFFAGVLAIGPVTAWSDIDGAGLGYLLTGLGYSMGIVLAVLATTATAERGTTAAASLERRRLDQYLPVKLVWLPRALVLAGFGALLWSIDLGPDGAVPESVTDAQLVAVFALDVVVLVVAEVLQHAVVRRRQPATEPDLLAADDAIRAQTVHTLAGAVIISASSFLGTLLWRSVWSEARAFDDVFETIAYLAPLAGWVVGIWYQNRAWRVRRSAGRLGASAPA